jgi:hypothetical protein
MFVMPNISPYMLGVMCIFMFGIGVWQHYSMFPYEYRESMVTDMLRQYSGFVMVLAVIISGLIFMFMFGQTPQNSNNIMPEIKMPNIFSGESKPNSKGMFNLTGNSINNSKGGIAGAIGSTVTNVSKSISNLMKPMNQTKSNSLVSPSFKVS